MSMLIVLPFVFFFFAVLAATAALGLAIKLGMLPGITFSQRRPRSRAPTSTAASPSAPFDLETFQHYKGGRYVGVVRATDEATGEPLVIYRSLSDGRVWARPERVFFEKVEVEGAMVPRFAHIANPAQHRKD